MRVLWIDDDEGFLRVQQRLLRVHHVVRTASTAAEAFAVLAVEKFDIILCDVNLPGMSGPTFFDRLSRLDAARVIFVTGGAWTDSAFLSKRPTLLKPFTQKQLLASVSKVGMDCAAE